MITSLRTFAAIIQNAYRISLPCVLVAMAPFATADLSAHFPFQETGGTNFVDASGNGIVGTALNPNGSGSLDVAGIIGSGYRPGPDTADYGAITGGVNALGIGGNGPRTIAFWFNTSSFSINNQQFRLIGMGSGAAASFDIMAENDAAGGVNSVGLRYGNGNVFYRSDNSNTAFATDTWYHIAVVYDGTALDLEPIGTPSDDSGLKFYVNGVLVNTAAGNLNNGTQALATSSTDLRIGAAADQADKGLYPGRIDELQIYDEALSAAAVLALTELPPPPTVAEVLGFSASPVRIVTAGSDVTLSWTIRDATTATLNPGNIDLLPLTTEGQGSLIVQPTETTTYTLDVSNTNGSSDQASLTVNVGALPPNVIVFFLDDFGWSDWQQNGAPTGSVFHETPHMNRLANEGKYFPNGYASAPVCSPTRGALMTGQAPAFHKVTEWISGLGDAGKAVREAEWIKKLPTTTPNFASILGGSGYRTLNIGKWHLGEGGTPEANPLNFGFHFNIGGNQFGTPPDPERYFASANGFSGLPNMGPDIAPNGSYLTDVLTQQAVAQIRQAAATDTAFAMYVPHYAVHTPIQAPAATVAKYQAKLANNPGMNWQGQTNPTYAAMVEHVDLSLGAILAALEDPDNNPATNDSIAENTLIIFTADNGGLIGVTSNRPLRDGKGGNYDGGIRQPWVFWWPGKISPGIVQEPIVTHDLLPTVLELADVPVPQGHVMTGQDLSPLLFGQPFERTRPLTFHYPHWSPQGGSPYSAIRRGDWKLIHLYATGTWELYNLANDIGESNNLITTETNLHAVLSWFLVDDLENLGANYPRNVTTLAELPPAPLVRDDVDTDGDGRSDFREAVEGTDPNNAQSFFQPAPALNGGQFQVTFNGLRHRRYRIWESADLTPGSWELATTLGPLANDSPLVYQKPATEDRLFFRIETLSP
jgi:arylsulfatase A-like enzyme